MDQTEDGVVVTSGCVLLSVRSLGLCIAMYRDPDKGENAWMLPKGHIHAGEDILDCAIRETREEVGATRFHVLTKLGSVRRRSVEHWGEVVDKEIVLFLAIDCGSAPLAPSEFETGTEAAWIPIADAVELVPYQEEAEFLRTHLILE
jgi:8-oxo-dGTP pyrophosphatase MutT (NUDIX family)